MYVMKALGLVINLVEYCEKNRQRVFYAEVNSLHKSSSHNRRCGSITAPKALVNVSNSFISMHGKEKLVTCM